MSASRDGDVIVVGAGNAAMAAALTARALGARVIVLEAAGSENAGGNARYAAGQMRTTYRGVEDLLEIVPDLTAGESTRRNQLERPEVE